MPVTASSSSSSSGAPTSATPVAPAASHSYLTSAAHWIHYNQSILAGAGGGLVNALVCSPLDVAKVRQQVEGVIHPGTSHQAGLWTILRDIRNQEGYRGWFRGLQPSLITLPFFWATYFPLYDAFRRRLGVEPNTRGAVWKSCLAAMGAAGVVDVLTNPLWVVRTRIISAVYHRTEQAVLQRLSVPGHMLHIAKHEGITALYKGLGASFLGLLHVAIQFPLYEELKHRARDASPDGRESILGLILASAGSKLVAGTITYPHEVVRARMQDSRNPAGLASIAKNILQADGWRGFYRGLHINILRVLPSCITTFVTYELIKQAIHKHVPSP